MPLPKSNNYTIEDIYALTDGQRAELIDGQIYDMAPPSPFHQELVMELSAPLRDYIKKNGGPYKVYPAPMLICNHLRPLQSCANEIQHNCYYQKIRFHIILLLYFNPICVATTPTIIPSAVISKNETTLPTKASKRSPCLICSFAIFSQASLLIWSEPYFA